MELRPSLGWFYGIGNIEITLLLRVLYFLALGFVVFESFCVRVVIAKSKGDAIRRWVAVETGKCKKHL